MYIRSDAKAQDHDADLHVSAKPDVGPPRAPGCSPLFRRPRSAVTEPETERSQSPPGDDHPRLCAAIVDRLTFNGAIIETGTESYRLAHTKAQQQLKAV